MDSIRILIVDDRPEFINALGHFLADEPLIEIVGSARSGREALAKVTELQPDLILMDYIMPKMNGIEAARQINTFPVAPRIVILTAYDTPEYRVASEKAGADGLIAKLNLGKELLPLIYRLFPQLRREELVFKDRPGLKHDFGGDK